MRTPEEIVARVHERLPADIFGFEIKICEHYGWDHTQWDDGVRQNNED